MRDTLYASVRAVPSLRPAVRANGNAAGAAVDLNLNGQRFRTAMVVVQTGTVEDGSTAITAEESATGSSGWSDVPASRRIGPLPTLTSSHDDVVREFEVLPDPARPFLRVVATTSGATAGGAIAAMILLGTPGHEPVIRG